MAGSTSYPGGLDDFALASPTNLGDDDIKGREHSERHDDMEAAMEAVQSALGTSPLTRFVADAKGDLLAATAADTVARLPVGTVGQVLGVDSTAGTGLAWRSPGATNLLTANQANGTEDGTTTGWSAYADCTIASSTAQAAQGSRSLAMTSTSTNTMYAAVATVPVVAGRVYTAVASVRAAAASNTSIVNLYWYNGSGGTISATSSPSGTPTTTGWTEFRATGVAPAGAVTAQLMVVSYAPAAAGQVYYVDKVGLWESPGGTWALPGEPIQGLGTYWDESVGRRQFAWDSVNARWQMVYSDTGLRDLSAVSLSNGWTVNGSQFWLRRVGAVVSLTLHGDAAAASSGVVYTAPAGFRPASAYVTSVPMGVASNTTRVVQFGTDGTVTVFNYGTGVHYISTTYLTTDAWPTLSPGSASGSIPSA